MSEILEGEIRIIEFQQDVDSYPLRENFENLKNAINDNQNQINNSLTPPAGSEVTDARDNMAVLQDRIRAQGLIHDGIISWGAVTPDADTTKVGISECVGIINGIGVKITAGISASLTAAAAGQHRLDLVVANSGNTFSILTGAESADTGSGLTTVFPAVSQKPLAVVYVDDTGPVNVTGNIYAVTSNGDLPIYMVTNVLSGNYPNGQYVFGDLIINAGMIFDIANDDSNFFRAANSQHVVIRCSGDLRITAAGGIDFAAADVLENTYAGIAGSGVVGGVGGALGAKTLDTFKVTELAYTNSKGGDGAISPSPNSGGGGGGGAGGWSAVGGNAGNGGTTGTAGASTAGAAPGITDDVRGTIIIIAKNIYLDGNIQVNGANGINGNPGAGTPLTSLASGGSGGNSAGTMVLIARDNLTVGAGAILDGSGGDGGDGGDATNGIDYNIGGGGGGGGAGAAIIIRAKTYTNNGTVASPGGSGGAAGSASGGGSGNAPGSAGSNGGAGIVDAVQYINQADILDNIMPLNFLGISLEGARFYG
ncbi:MAG: hypothetical protein JRL30_27720 [Deltaproteobacteria bacterium]|nr:hypothetical protein [Deltaproteobacteria bacterium]